MYLIECVDKRLHGVLKQANRQWYLYEPDDPVFRSKKKCFVRSPLDDKWHIGFPSYDRTGIVFQIKHGVWGHTGFIKNVYVTKRRRPDVSVVGYKVVTRRLPFEERLRRGIAVEKIVVSDLYRSRYIPKTFKIHHLVDSGAKCRGVDILLSFFDIDISIAVPSLKGKFFNSKYPLLRILVWNTWVSISTSLNEIWGHPEVI